MKPYNQKEYPRTISRERSLTAANISRIDRQDAKSKIPLSFLYGTQETTIGDIPLSRLWGDRSIDPIKYASKLRLSSYHRLVTSGALRAYFGALSTRSLTALAWVLPGDIRSVANSVLFHRRLGKLTRAKKQRRQRGGQHKS